jgi:DNA helicase-2/ATP-dependent DNA helicase PcrA
LSETSTERQSRILGGLNEVQKKAVLHMDGPLVVFAGAGSGKTRIITNRIAWLIEQGVHPWEILAVTFTNKAAGEMRARVAALSPFGNKVLISTFHSACARWLREFAPELGYTSDFTIYDDKDQLTAIKSVIAELNVKLDEETTAQDFRAAINKAKTLSLFPHDERLSKENDLMPTECVAVYRKYQEYLAACNAMDFSDLLMNVLLLLRRNDLVRGVLQGRYKYILVDEYQDTNRTQFELIARLAEKHRNLFVVGDDDQSIYSWRGAVPANIIDFDKMYPDAVKITMEQNYRCTSNIVNAASAMVSNNKRRVKKKLFTQNPSGDLINYRLETDHEMESWWVVDSIKSEKKTFAYDDVAIFYRTNSQSRQMEDALRRENIPYQIYGTVRFYDRAEVKDLMAYLRILVNPNDDVSVKRVLNVPTRGIGKKAIDTLEAEAGRRGISIYKTIEQFVESNYPKLGSKLKVFIDLINKLKADVKDSPVDEVLEILLESTGYLAYVEKKHREEASDKIENIHELGSALADFAAEFSGSGVAEWLQSVTLSSSEGDNKSGVTLMTMHMAKGLEFSRVYIIGMEEGILPHKNSLDDNESIEEERRLFYVGMTRAMKKLSLLGAYRRRTFNQWGANKPSRFLSEIPSEYFNPMSGAEQNYVQMRKAETADYFDSGVSYEYEEPEISLGQAVSHPTFGKGLIRQIMQEYGQVKVVVDFSDFGVRKVSAHHLQRPSL